MNETKSTKFDKGNLAHQILVGTMAVLVDDFGYTPREMFELIEDVKKQTYFTFQEMSKEKGNANGSH
ncbi:hypothetical protein HP398_29875 [Brevibacillus sp. HB1.4B]|uniref:hypothetical protein n=1 Tax=Brevibacillus sp. HB1.4B TaxID=2738845 RepID=UPI00156AE818|nr:hypothetical protein [Brevibacillus sp. HB1.4B]NRS20632.1 hypothetical protein [Brevibacillus sp. HB1.4B]